jgi:hypothetical protein
MLVISTQAAKERLASNKHFFKDNRHFEEGAVIFLY